MDTAVVDYTTCSKSVAAALNGICAAEVLAGQERILIKPNLVNATPHPVTTPVSFTRAVVEYVRANTDAAIVIAEGCGDLTLTTAEVFDALGYGVFEEEFGIPLLDLNEAKLRRLSDPECPFLPEIWLPEIAFTHYVISLPVLKAHSLSMVTGSLKNMVGFAPPKHYAGRHGTWKKAAFHEDIHQAIIDLNRYRTPDLSLMDASVGLADYHLGGATCKPHAGKVIAGFDPLDVDRKACGLLGLDWRKVPHLAPSVMTSAQP